MPTGVYVRPARWYNGNFWTTINVGAEDECWNTKSNSPNRYPQINWHGQRKSQHRIAFYLTEGYWPEVVRHTCVGNTRCCNPFHLVSGTPADNVQDCIRQGRNVKGEMVGNHKLFESEVLDIRNRPSEAAKNLAAEYGVTSALIYMIRTRKVWKHL